MVDKTPFAVGPPVSLLSHHKNWARTIGTVWRSVRFREPFIIPLRLDQPSHVRSVSSELAIGSLVSNSRVTLKFSREPAQLLELLEVKF